MGSPSETCRPPRQPQRPLPPAQAWALPQPAAGTFSTAGTSRLG